MEKYVKVSCRQEVTGLNPDEEKVLKEALTFDNPAYAKAVKYGKSGFISKPEHLYYYARHGNVFEVPLGVDLDSILPKAGFKYQSCIDHRFIWEAKRGVNIFPEFCLELREDQKKAAAAFQKRFSLTSYGFPCTGIIQMPTGKGKTILGIYLARYFNQKTLIMVHKDDLVLGWKEDIKQCFNGLADVGIIKAKKRETGKHFTIATVQTLARMTDDELSKYTSQFGMVIQDEVHHIGASTFNIVDKFSSLIKLGLSATPSREDGLSHVFNIYYNGIVYNHKYVKDDKDISNVKVYLRVSPVHFYPYVNSRKKGKEDYVLNYFDYEGKTLPDGYASIDSYPSSKRPVVPYAGIDTYIMHDMKFKVLLGKDIISHFKQGHSCLVLFKQKESVDLYYNYLKRYIPGNFLMKYYGDSKEKTSILLKRAENREVLVTLATYSKTSEGTNVKAWEVLFLASSVNNAKDVKQSLGRIRRKAENKLKTVLVYDYCQKDVYGFSKHVFTRVAAYNELKCEIV